MASSMSFMRRPGSIAGRPMTAAAGLFSLPGVFRSVGSRCCLRRSMQKWLTCWMDARHLSPDGLGQCCPSPWGNPQTARGRGPRPPCRGCRRDPAPDDPASWWMPAAAMCTWTRRASPPMSTRFRSTGCGRAARTRTQNLDRAIRAENAVIEGFPGVTFGLHVCRGNPRGVDAQGKVQATVASRRSLRQHR